MIARHPECPTRGRLDPRALAQVTILKFDDRLPHRKVCRALKRGFGLEVAPATVLEVTRRVSHALKDGYGEIKKRIRQVEVVYIDEAGIRVNGAKYWIWVFTNEADALVVMRHSREEEGVAGGSGEELRRRHRLRQPQELQQLQLEYSAVLGPYTTGGRVRC